MNCPVCNHSLEATKYQYLPFHLCRQCGGIWVETKMLRHLATRLAAELGVKPNKPMTLRPKTVARWPKDEPVRLCPKCGKEMKKLNYSYDSNVFIDRCMACNGIWLDKGEIMQLAAYHQIDEKAVLLGRELLQLQNKSDEEEGYIALIITAVIALVRLLFRF